MTPFVLFVSLLAAQPDPDVRVISAVAPGRDLYRVALLPGLLEPAPGDALELGYQADTELTKAVPDRYSGSPSWKTESSNLMTEQPLTDIDPKRFERVLKPAAKAQELWERAARSPRADWSYFTKHQRRAGFNGGTPAIPDFETGIQLLAVQARFHLKQNRPLEAIRSLGLALSLARHLNGCPNPFQANQVGYLTDQLLDVLQDCQAHPRCPDLSDALAALPRPFLTPRAPLEGLHLILTGSLGGERVRADPVGAQLNPDAQRFLDRTYRVFTSYNNQRTDPLVVRLQMGLAIQKADAAAREAMRDAGYSDKVIAATPAVNAAILHSLFAGEEMLGRITEAMSLAHDIGTERLNALDTAYPRGPVKPGTPAIPSVRFVIEQSLNLRAPFHAVERRLDLLRTVEVLRRHAHQTGSLPAKLADVKGIAVPNDPLTGKPFDYQLEKDIATLESPPVAHPSGSIFNVTLRLRLLPVEEKKP
jgi:hypothetical protein